jgi:pyruvate dehydrogenase complex dehydrogenase (E1) component
MAQDGLAAFEPAYVDELAVILAFALRDQWRRHLQQQEYVSDVTQAIDRSIASYNENAELSLAAVRHSAASTEVAVRESAPKTTPRRRLRLV